MPIVTIEMYSGRSEEMKLDLTKAIVKEVSKTLNIGEEAIIVSLKEITKDEYPDKVAALKEEEIYYSEGKYKN